MILDTPDAVQDYTPMSVVNRQVPPAPVHTVSSDTPLGKRGRLANLAATIGSWEDDLSHAHIPSESSKDKPSKTVPTVAHKDAKATTSSVTASKTVSSSNQVSSPGIFLKHHDILLTNLHIASFVNFKFLFMCRHAHSCLILCLSLLSSDLHYQCLDAFLP